MVRVDCYKMTVEHGGQRVRMTRGPFLLVHLLAARPGFVLNRAQLMDALEMSPEVFDRAVDSCVKRVRQELRPIGLSHAILAVFGVGYAWDESVPAEVVEIDPDAFVFHRGG